MDQTLVRNAAAYYAGRLKEHGATPRGVDWNSLESQRLRFEQLLRIVDGEPVDILDYGCGYGALADFLDASGTSFSYVGYDAAPEMITAARQRRAGDPRCVFHAERDRLDRRPFAIASGVLNVKQDASDEQWWQYVTSVLDDLARLGERGFAVNLLTAYSDAERQRPDLYYASPEDVFGYCITHFSRHVALLHDYPLYEFSVLVRTEHAWRDC
jgi:SAM-dependent methyltransferase